MAAPAWAQQAEWSQSYDAASRIRVKRSGTPVLSGQAAAATEQAIEHYRDIVARLVNSTLETGTSCSQVMR